MELPRNNLIDADDYGLNNRPHSPPPDQLEQPDQEFAASASATEIVSSPVEHVLNVKRSLANFCDELDRHKRAGLAMPALDEETTTKLLESLDWMEQFVQSRLAAAAENEAKAKNDDDEEKIILTKIEDNDN